MTPTQQPLDGGPEIPPTRGSSTSSSQTSRRRRRGRPPTRPVRRRPPEVLTEAEVLALIKACSARAPTGIRNRALIAMLWRSGLRISEALALELRDVDLEAGTLGSATARATSPARSAWTNRPRRCWPAGSTVGETSHLGARAPIFCTLRGGRIDSSYIRHLLPRLARKAGRQTAGARPWATAHLRGRARPRENADQRHPRRARAHHRWRSPTATCATSPRCT